MYTTNEILLAALRLGTFIGEVVTAMPCRVCTSDRAPDTYDKLVRAWRFKRGEVIVVSDLHCDNTIYPLPEDNINCRAWHDYLHLTMNKPFTLEGELAVAAAQCLAVEGRFGHGSLEHKIMVLDTVGQTMYNVLHRKFPDDQRSWIIQQLKEKVA